MTIEEVQDFLEKHDLAPDSWIYGSPCKEMQPFMCPPKARFFHVDPQETGHYTLVVCPSKLREASLERLDIIQVSSPISRRVK